MSFYITLPSNALMNYHPDNVQSNFTINLPDRLLLDNNYKVGLAEISYNQSVNVNLGVIELSAKINDLYEKNGESDFITRLLEMNKDFVIKMEITSEDCIKLSDLFATLNTQININLIKSFANFLEAERLVDTSNNNWSIIGAYFDAFINKIQPEFLYDFGTNKSALKLKKKVSINFIRQLIELLNIEELNAFDEDSSHTLDILGNQIIHVCDSYNVWTNIVQEQIFGDVKAKILRNVIPDGNHGQHITLIYSTVHYVDLHETSFQSINIKIKDNNDQPIHFTNKLSKVVVKLHFKYKYE
jgi:hypothetical protein